MENQDSQRAGPDDREKQTASRMALVHRNRIAERVAQQVKISVPAKMPNFIL